MYGVNDSAYLSSNTSLPRRIDTAYCSGARGILMSSGEFIGMFRELRSPAESETIVW